MEFASILNKLGDTFKYDKVNDKEYKITLGAKITPKTPIEIYLEQNDAGTFYFTDHKATLKYMSQIYELKSPDVKNCIAAVVKIYNFNISSGEIIANIRSESLLIETFYNFVICIGQLANMYAFFDKP